MEGDKGQRKEKGINHSGKKKDSVPEIICSIAHWLAHLFHKHFIEL